jgi:hypothetical protein
MSDPTDKTGMEKNIDDIFAAVQTYKEKLVTLIDLSEKQPRGRKE